MEILKNPLKYRWLWMIIFIFNLILLIPLCFVICVYFKEFILQDNLKEATYFLSDKVNWWL